MKLPHKNWRGHSLTHVEPCPRCGCIQYTFAVPKAMLDFDVMPDAAASRFTARREVVRCALCGLGCHGFTIHDTGIVDIHREADPWPAILGART